MEDFGREIEKLNGEINALREQLKGKFETLENLLRLHFQEHERQNQVWQKFFDKLNQRINGKAEDIEKQEERLRKIEMEFSAETLRDHEVRIRGLERAWAKYAGAIAVVVTMINIGVKVLLG